MVGLPLRVGSLAPCKVYTVFNALIGPCSSLWAAMVTDPPYLASICTLPKRYSAILRVRQGLPPKRS